MRVLLALLAIAASVMLLGWIARRDPKRVRSQDGEGALRTPLTSRQRRLLALGAVAPGLLLMLSGWWSSTIMWIGATVTLSWLWVVWLSRSCRSSAAAPDQGLFTLLSSLRCWAKWLQARREARSVVIPHER